MLDAASTKLVSLDWLIEGLPMEGGEAGFLPNITGLAEDSRACTAGFLFAGLPGVAANGVDFVADAVTRGAVALLVPEGVVLPDVAGDVVVIKSQDIYEDWARVVRRFLAAQPGAKGYPQKLVGVTGTNGKSSVVHFCRQIWHALGIKAASIGTLGVMVDADRLIEPLLHTTPSILQMHQWLDRLARLGVSYVAVEASSHGLDQQRLAGMVFDAAGYTQLSRDHLDYHGDMASYAAAKQLLFTRHVQADGVAVLNRDDGHYKDFETAVGQAALVRYGKAGKELQLVDVKMLPYGMEMEVQTLQGRHRLEVPLIGSFQAENLLCALGLVLATTDKGEEEVMASTRKVTALHGRMECVARHEVGAMIVVDYAHTPDALEKALRAVRSHCASRLHLVFGCGGNRDVGKRAEMGAVAYQHADRVIVTDDNPRNEAPEQIRAAIMQACPGAKEVGDRREAIDQAIDGLREGDVLIVAGKGHEDYQLVGTEKLAFSDSRVIVEHPKTVAV